MGNEYKVMVKIKGEWRHWNTVCYEAMAHAIGKRCLNDCAEEYEVINVTRN